ncbi:hypothetical protein PDJAM_G00031580 [Pangasius djambal]|uniref:Uncharacterized protein n=1 Tax=Pangasius djambal TaxID=1691987 RepID=A0ACC5YQL0_9TELE|nr:hypothetical protein [Pangasius djambal]
MEYCEDTSLVPPETWGYVCNPKTFNPLLSTLYCQRGYMKEINSEGFLLKQQLVQHLILLGSFSYFGLLSI